MTKDNLTREEARNRATLIRNPEYDVSLELTGGHEFFSETVIRFRCSQAGGFTHLDLMAERAEVIELNGRPVDPEAFDGTRIALAGLAAENVIRVVAACRTWGAELGMHRFQDPVDGGRYMHTHFEPFGSHRVFACFDQPDIKGRFTFHLTTPEDWKALSNGAVDGEPERLEGGRLRWSFVPTEPMPTYVTSVVAGPYHEVREQHGHIDLGLLVRASLAGSLEADELFETTKAGFDFFEEAFDYRYPFGKYDQVFVPESNTGAMENAGLVTFNDEYVFRSRVTEAAREWRVNTVLHEMAHMWFGDLVTMRWWNDLWLNESFATFMAVLAESQVTRFRDDAWITFANNDKGWALRQDQLPTTHPIVAEIPDIESIYLNFDGITYAKGASVLRQLVAWVGRDRFLEGIKKYTRAHEFGNAELSDFLAALEESSGRDLDEWSKEWLQTAGVNTLRASFTVREDGGREVFERFELAQEAPAAWPTLRRHRVAVGLFDSGPDGLTRRRRVEFDADGERTEVPELAGEAVPDLTLVNDGDLTFAKVRLDARSQATLVARLGDLEDSLARAVCWAACWDMTREGEMRPRDYLELVLRNIGRETEISVLQSLLRQASSAVWLYGHPDRRPEGSGRLSTAARESMHVAEPGSDHQLAWARAFIASARAEPDLATVRGLLDGSVTVEGLVVDTELRWHIVSSLAAAGAGGEELIEAELARDRTDQGVRHAAAARAGRPTPAAKERAWQIIVGHGEEPLALVEAVMGGFQRFGQEDVLAPYAERFFEDLPGVWERRDIPDALAYGRAMYPLLIVEPSTVEMTDRYLAQGNVPGPMRRLLLEGKDGIERALRARAADGSS